MTRHGTTLGRLAAALILLAAGSAPAWGASAVSYDKATGVFAYHVDPDLTKAKQEAERLCRAAGGQSCVAFTSCTRPGHGAIAFSAGTSTLSAACGADSQERADSEALANCAYRAFDTAGCLIVAGYQDDNPAGTIDQGYFNGRWATNCDGPTSYRFEFVSTQEFMVQECKAGVCESGNARYSPSGSEQVFVFPSNNSRIIKRSRDTLEWRRTNTQLLRRCPA